ncbi:MAG: tetratricopeptide repeat protein [Cyanobacteria bacterium]|nr:tetratricopeptide repeat protein [Cyanobacteriota bacterium]
MMRKTTLTALFGILIASWSSQPAFATDLEEGAKLYTAKEYMKARPFFEKAAKESPKSWQAHYYLANTCLALGQMSTAKYEYQLCQQTCTKPAILAQCKAGIARAGGPRASTGTSGGGGSSASSSTSSSASTGGGGGGSPASDAQTQMSKRKEQILEQARKDVEKVKADAKAQLEAEKSNANQYYQGQDGTVKTDISSEREAEIQQETEAKCKKIMEEAERRARSIH